VEKLFRIGDDSLDDLLVRSLYSWSSGYQRAPEHAPLNFTFIFGDAAYFLNHPQTLAVYGEFRQGINIKLGGPLLMTPHFVVGGRYLNQITPSDSYWEAGGGVSFRYYFNQNRYESYRSALEFLIQGKGGTFLRQPPGIKDKQFGGLVFSLLFHF
jgi:hypothetical protein